MLKMSNAEESQFNFIEAMYNGVGHCLDFNSLTVNYRIQQNMFDIVEEDIKRIIMPFRSLVHDINTCISTKDYNRLYTLINNITKNPLETISSSILISEPCKQASIINPVTLSCVAFTSSCYNKENNEIYIGFPPHFKYILEYLLKEFTDLSNTCSNLNDVIRILKVSAYSPDIYLYLYYSLTYESLHSHIYYELSKWLFNSGIFISKDTYGFDFVTDIYGYTSSYYFTLPEKDMNIENLLLFNSIVPIGIWNSYTFKDLIEQDIGLLTFYTQTQRTSEGKMLWNKFKQNLLNRMRQRNILGKNMR